MNATRPAVFRLVLLIAALVSFPPAGIAGPVDGPLADYTTQGIDDERLSTGVAGIIGVTVTFAVGFGLFLVMKQLGRRDVPPPAPVAASSSAPGP